MRLALRAVIEIQNQEKTERLGKPLTSYLRENALLCWFLSLSLSLIFTRRCQSRNGMVWSLPGAAYWWNAYFRQKYFIFAAISWNSDIYQLYNGIKRVHHFDFTLYLISYDSNNNIYEIVHRKFVEAQIHQSGILMGWMCFSFWNN